MCVVFFPAKKLRNAPCLEVGGMLVVGEAALTYLPQTSHDRYSISQ